MAKRARELEVKERRTRKREKKQAAAAARNAELTEETLPAPPVDSEPAV
jgi:hypothetical protein